MGPMAQIEMMVFLQGVDLFAHCNAEQVLRLAAIASEHSYDKGEVIFRRQEPADSLYCVVEGRVRLDAEDGSGVVIGPSGRFGVLAVCNRFRTSVLLTNCRVDQAHVRGPGSLRPRTGRSGRNYFPVVQVQDHDGGERRRRPPRR